MACEIGTLYVWINIKGDIYVALLPLYPFSSLTSDHWNESTRILKFPRRRWCCTGGEYKVPRIILHHKMGTIIKLIRVSFFSINSCTATNSASSSIQCHSFNSNAGSFYVPRNHERRGGGAWLTDWLVAVFSCGIYIVQFHNSHPLLLCCFGTEFVIGSTWKMGDSQFI